MPAKKPNLRSSTDNKPTKLVIIGMIVAGALAAISFGLVVSADPAEARFPINNFTAIDDDAIMNPSGQNIEVTGTTQCTEGELVKVNVRVEQDGVEAIGQTLERCLGEDTVLHWNIHAATRGPSSFVADEDAHVWAEARTYSKGKETDFHDWNEDVTVIERDG